MSVRLRACHRKSKLWRILKAGCNSCIGPLASSHREWSNLSRAKDASTLPATSATATCSLAMPLVLFYDCAT